MSPWGSERGPSVRPLDPVMRGGMTREQTESGQREMSEEFTCGYCVRVSDRARNVILRVIPGKGLEVVIPEGYDRRKIPEILARQRNWLERIAGRLTSRDPAATPAALLPKSIDLPAVGTHHGVHYTKRCSPRLVLVESARGDLELSGDTDNAEGCLALLQRWLHHQARRSLIPWLDEVGKAIGMSCGTVQIRAQRTKWGSCSSRQTVSLNRNLLFLPPRLVRYLMIHELCHTRVPDHSARFWSLVEVFEASWRQLDREMNQAAEVVPRWANWRP